MVEDTIYDSYREEKYTRKKVDTVQIRKIWIYLLSFLFVAVPVVIGIVVWRVHVNSCASPQTEALFEGTQKPDEDVITDPIPPTSKPEPTTIDPNIGKLWDNFRLPRDIIPLHYDITIYPNFYDNNTIFLGREIIEVEVVNSTKLIMIHCKDIIINAIQIFDANRDQPVDITRNFTYAKYDFLVLELSSTLTIGDRLEMRFEFEGSLVSSGFFPKNTGIYTFSYTTANNETKSQVVSLFHPALARTAFPCFDEPGFKSTFNITLIHDSNYTALSNMPEEDSTDSIEHPGLRATRFQTSPPMTTYTLAFAVCDYDHNEVTSANGHLVRVWHDRDKMPEVQFALELAAYLVNFTENYFDIEDPMPKHDLIAVPSYYYLAMESWGIFMFRSSELEYDPIKADTEEKRSVAIYMSHVFALNWFGNLVTFDWWNDAWLHEGFATYYSYIFTDSYLPELDIMMHRLPAIFSYGMVSDVGGSDPPLIHDVTSHSKMQNMFSGLIYFKGPSLVRMMNNVMRPENFQLAVQTYIKSNAWGNVVTDDLWTAFSQIDGFADIKTIMDAWTRKKGYPYIDVTVQYNETSKLATVNVSQHRYTKDSKDDDTDQFLFMEPESNQPPDTTWYVPLQFVTSQDPETPQMIWMNGTDVTFELPININDQSTWIKFNSMMMGYYHVKYPDDMLNRIVAALQTDINILQPFDRFNLFNDALRLTDAGLIPYSAVLDMNSYMSLENSYPIWYWFFSGLFDMLNQFEYQKSRNLLFEYFITIGKPFTEQLGWEMKTDTYERNLQLFMIDLMCFADDPMYLQRVGAMFRQWIDNNIELLNMLATNESVIRPDHVDRLFTLISRSPYGRDMLWQWLRANWFTLTHSNIIFHSILESALKSVTLWFNTDEQLKEVNAFFAQYPDNGDKGNGIFGSDTGSAVPNTGVTESTQTSILKVIDTNIRWMEKNYEDIVAWLKK